MESTTGGARLALPREPPPKILTVGHKAQDLWYLRGSLPYCPLLPGTLDRILCLFPWRLRNGRRHFTCHLNSAQLFLFREPQAHFPTNCQSPQKNTTATKGGNMYIKFHMYTQGGGHPCRSKSSNPEKMSVSFQVHLRQQSLAVALCHRSPPFCWWGPGGTVGRHSGG